MEKPRKSKALIITFIIILLLLIVGYWLFSKKDQIFKTDGINFGRIFESLVETPGMKPLDVLLDRIFPNRNTGDDIDADPIYDPDNNINKYNLPVISISASPSSINAGEASVITWTSTNAMSCRTPNGTEVGTSGSFSTGILNKSKSFSVSCTGYNGTISKDITVKVGDREIDPFLFPIVNASANPSPIDKGERSTISWDSVNTTSCDTGQGNPTTVSGNFKTEKLDQTTSYSIICTGDDGTTSRNVFVIVKTSFEQNDLECANEADNYPLCTTLNGECLNEATNPPLCTTSDSGQCLNGAINPEACDIFENAFCKANKITEELSTTKNTNKDLIKSLQTVLSKLTSSLGSTYLQNADIDGDYGPKTETAVKLFQKDNNLTETGIVDIVTSTTLDTKCNEFFSDSDNYLAQCNDNIDNDNDGKIDSEDPSCHTDFDANDSSSYDEFIRDENRVKISAQCGDGLNNDNEEGPDHQDKDCHTDNNINNWESYYPEIQSETGGLPTPDEDDEDGGNDEQDNEDDEDGEDNGEDDDNTITEPNKCAIFEQYPLEFNDKEKADLAELLRKFYLLAPSLKTEDDLDVVYNEIDRYKELIRQTKELTKQCYLESASQTPWMYNDPNGWDVNGEKWAFCTRNPDFCDPTDTFNTSYTGPTARSGNPWFRPDNFGSYVDVNKYKEVVYNTDLTYLLKIHGGAKISPLLTKNPPAQSDRTYRLNWDFPRKKSDASLGWLDLIPIVNLYNRIDDAIDFYEYNTSDNNNIANSMKYDLNAVMVKRLTEFEDLLNIW